MAELPISPNEVLISNRGYMKLNGIELAELSSLEIKITPETKTLGIMNSPTKGEIIVAYNGTIDFELHKTSTLFKPALLESAKELRPFNFSLEATVYNPQKDKQESIYIDNCWFKGDVNLFTLKAEGDFLSEKFSAGFTIESSEFTDVIDSERTDTEWTSK